MSLHIARYRHVLLALGLVPVLAACENSATAFKIDSRDHSLVLMREQKFLWDDELKQAVVVTRMPKCQKRVLIHPSSVDLVEMKVYEAGDRLWALHQGQRWYLASTEACRVQDWDNAEGQAPGRWVGSFVLKDGEPAFVAAPADGG